MRLLRNIRYFFENLSARAIRELVVVLILLCLATALSLPQFISDLKQVKMPAAAASAEDDWKMTTPEQQGMDGHLLKEAGEMVGQTAALSLVVVRHGAVVYERYYGEGGAEQYNNVFSVTKSVVSVLTGIAMREGYIGGASDKLEKYFASEISDAGDSRWRDMEIRHLLTMTPGFCEDLGPWTHSGNWVKATFELPLQAKPGERFQYANSASHLLAVLLSDASGTKLEEFADRYLFSPLGITKWRWASDPQGYNTGYANLFLRPRDMAKIGLLYLNKGQWNGTQLVPEAWVEESTRLQFDFVQEKLLSQGDPRDRSIQNNGYGYKWWIDNGMEHSMFSAVGYGGQYICVIPDLDIVTVVTSIPDHPMSFNDEYKKALFENCILPAVKDAGKGG